ncbi:MAG: DUF2066 domain-containing protein [Rhodanobacteraceae bacterium]
MMRFLLPRVLVASGLVLGVAGMAMAQTTPAANTGAAVPPAAAPASPYSATVPVAGTSDAQRNTAIASALVQVLQQVSPGTSANTDELAQASGYVRDFHYRRAASGNGLELQVDFDPGAIGRLVAAAQAAATTAGATPAAGGTAAAVAQGGSGSIWVDGIDNSHAFASLLSTLRGDDQLHDVTPVGAHNDGVMLHLGFDQPLASVLAGLTGPGGHLTMGAQPHAGADAVLRWIP